MKTAELEDLKRDTSQLDVFVHGHENIHLMSGGHAVAILTPLPKPVTTAKIQWPDFEAQRRAIFGDRVLPAGTIQELMDEERGEY
jgi:antitoxin (DNA-binding transcriptional repressor) of toxin-antitoxin stability system